MEFFVAALVTLFVTVDPVGNTPLFLSITSEASPRQRIMTAVKGPMVSCLLMILMALAGDAFLRFLGISLPAFRIAGGLLLFLIAFEMLFAKRRQRRTNTAEQMTAETTYEDVSIFPLAFPLLAGPGTIASVVLLSVQAQGGLGLIWLLAAIIAVSLVTLLILASAARVVDYLSPTLIDMLTRLFGLLLAALSVQFVLDGVTGYWQMSMNPPVGL